MSDSEFLSILMRILSAAQDRQDASHSRRPPSSEGRGGGDSAVRADEGAQSSGDGDDERRGTSVKRFIQQTSPKARPSGARKRR